MNGIDSRLFIINYLPDVDGYSCLALDALFDMETGVPKTEELKKRLEITPPDTNIECALIELLNNSIK